LSEIRATTHMNLGVFNWMEGSHEIFNRLNIRGNVGPSREKVRERVNTNRKKPLSP